MMNGVNDEWKRITDSIFDREWIGTTAEDIPDLEGEYLFIRGNRYRRVTIVSATDNQCEVECAGSGRTGYAFVSELKLAEEGE